MEATSVSLARILTTGALLAVSVLAQAAPSGAIFTTVADGSRVNANIFSAKCDGLGVYLDGGPGPNAPARPRTWQRLPAFWPARLRATSPGR